MPPTSLSESPQLLVPTAPTPAPKPLAANLLNYSLTTAFYRQQRQVVDPKDRWILDFGCLQGESTQVLAEANPGARIVAVDDSDEMLAQAQQNLQQGGFEQVEFRLLKLEELATLGKQFDCIHCGEAVRLAEDPVAVLRSLRTHLKPDGILCANLFERYQRQAFHQSQTLFGMVGLTENPQQDEMDVLIETMNSLKPITDLKQRVWRREHQEQPTTLLTHYLGSDRGYTIPDLFALLHSADLEFVSMTNFWQWDFFSLFQNPKDLPDYWKDSKTRYSAETRLYFYELLNPIHQCLNFWCAVPGTVVTTDPADWTAERWQQATVHLHPLFQQAEVKAAIATAFERAQPFDIGTHFPLPGVPRLPIDSRIAAALLPLWETAQPFSTLVNRYQTLSPNPQTLEPIKAAEANGLKLTDAIAPLRDYLVQLESVGYVLLEG